MTKTKDNVPGCQICAHFGRLTPEETIWSDDYWVAGGIMDAPGWVMVATHRHAEGSWGVSDEEAAELGPVMRNLCRAVKDVTGSERVHVAAAGEVALHFHYLIMPRRPGETPVIDSMEIARRMQEASDKVRASETGARIRARLAPQLAGVAGSKS